MDNAAFAATPAQRRIVAGLVRVTRVLVLALPVVNLTEAEEHHIHRLARYLISEADRTNPDVQRVQLLGSLLRSQLAEGPAAATLGAVLADSFDEALNGSPEPAVPNAAIPAPHGTARRHAARRRISSTPASRRGRASGL